MSQEIEFKLKCMFCSAEDQIQKEEIGYIWRYKWTCPNCKITYRIGKGYWGNTRRLYIRMGDDEEEDDIGMITKEWEKKGHKYNEVK